MKIKYIGWKEENPFVPMILLSQEQINSLKINYHTILKVSFGGKISLAIVQRQHIKDINKNYCSINNLLANILNLELNETIKLNKTVSDIEFKKFKKETLIRAFGVNNG